MVNLLAISAPGGPLQGVRLIGVIRVAAAHAERSVPPDGGTSFPGIEALTGERN